MKWNEVWLRERCADVWIYYQQTRQVTELRTLSGYICHLIRCWVQCTGLQLLSRTWSGRRRHLRMLSGAVNCVLLAEDFWISRYSMSNYGRRAFCFAGPYVWNSLPEPMQQSTSIAVFERSLKTFLLQQILHLYKCTDLLLITWAADVREGRFGDIPRMFRQHTCSDVHEAFQAKTESEALTDETRHLPDNPSWDRGPRWDRDGKASGCLKMASRPRRLDRGLIPGIFGCNRWCHYLFI